MRVAVFLPISVFRRKGISNGTKPSQGSFLEQTQPRRLGVLVWKSVKLPRGRGRAPHPSGPHGAPPTYFFRLYILLYPRSIAESHETTFPPPKPFVLRSHLGAFSGDLPEGELITEGFYINTIASPMMCE